MTTTNSEKETKELARKLAKKVEKGGVICLYGDLGTGKTVMAKGISEHFGIKDFKVKSPTYTYIRKISDNIFHIDLYRLEQVDHLLAEEIDEIIQDHKNIVIIEWPERMEEYLPSKRINIKLEYVDEQRRNITIV